MPTIPFRNPGVTYNGLHSTQKPTVREVAADLATTKRHFGSARTYYPQYGGGVVDVGKVAKEANLNLLLGLFLYPGHDDWTPTTTSALSNRPWRGAISRASLLATRTRT
jgi:exo-beta-1,3-glucanase (GH17 family)